MSDLAQVEIDRDVAEVAARRAAEEGLTVAEYLSLVLRRSFERDFDEQSVLAYDHVGDGAEVAVDREAGEDAESYDERARLYSRLFPS